MRQFKAALIIQFGRITEISMKITTLYVLFCALVPLMSIPAFCQTLESGNQQIQLIELYTSEGCSSCPAADRWMTGLLNDPDLWTRFVPVAFHVDYWDSLGWPDAFAKPEFSQRQRIYQLQRNIATVYTPGFVVQGKEWRGWFRNFERPSNPKQIVGNLSVKLSESRAQVTFHPENSIENGTLYFTRLGFGYERKISRGENAGKILKEDFIVLDFHQKPVSLENNQLSAEFELNRPETEPGIKLAAAAWISTQRNQSPMQAVGGWLSNRPREAN